MTTPKSLPRTSHRSSPWVANGAAANVTRKSDCQTFKTVVADRGVALVQRMCLGSRHSGQTQQNLSVPKTSKNPVRQSAKDRLNPVALISTTTKGLHTGKRLLWQHGFDHLYVENLCVAATKVPLPHVFPLQCAERARNVRGSARNLWARSFAIDLWMWPTMRIRPSVGRSWQVGPVAERGAVSIVGPCSLHGRWQGLRPDQKRTE